MTLDFIKCSQLIGKDPEASLVAEHRLRCECSSCGSWPLERRLSGCGDGISCSTARGIFLGQGSNPCLLHWQADSSTEPPEKPVLCTFTCSNVHTKKMEISRPDDFTHLFSLPHCFHSVILPACNPYRLLGRWFTFLVLGCMYTYWCVYFPLKHLPP